MDVVVCLIGNGTAWREWVDFELLTAYQERKGICGVRLKGSRGQVPPILRELHAPVAPWHLNAITAAIECAAARRG
ncbi:MAG TPA: TIR domain-containing protein [Longimicrobium sp.]|nr:TIR domain-containing protein [Longimicrobium sp.]